MGIGFSIFLLALGAILAFAVNVTVAGVNLHAVGWVLMATGALGLVLTMVVIAPRRRRTIVSTRAVPGPGSTFGSANAPAQGVVEREVRDELS
jgi:hypothetical protein